MLDDPKPAVRRTAVFALRVYPAQARAAAGRLVELLHDASPEVGRAAWETLGAMAPWTLPEVMAAAQEGRIGAQVVAWLITAAQEDASEVAFAGCLMLVRALGPLPLTVDLATFETFLGPTTQGLLRELVRRLQ